MLHQQTFSSGLSRTAGTTLSKTQQETPRALISFVLKWWSRRQFKRKIRLTVHFWQVHPWVKLTFTYFRWILGTYKVWAYWGLSGGVTVKVLTSKWWYAQTTLTWPNFELCVYLWESFLSSVSVKAEFFIKWVRCLTQDQPLNINKMQPFCHRISLRRNQKAQIDVENRS